MKNKKRQRKTTTLSSNPFVGALAVLRSGSDERSKVFS